MQSWTFYIVTIIFLLLVLLYKYLTKNNGYWKARGIPEAKGAVFLFGHAWDLFFLRKSFATALESHYKEHKNSSMVGVYMGPSPAIIAKHPDVVKFVLHSGFPYFCDNPTLDKKIDPLLHHDPFFQNGQKWKDSRGIFVSALSSKKLKDRVSAIQATCDQMVKYLKEKIPANSSLEVEGKNLFSNYTGGVAAISILGIDGHTFIGEDSQNSIRQMMDAIFVPEFKKGIQQVFSFLFPMLAKIISARFVPMWVNNEYARMAKEVKSVRDKDNAQRNDVMQHIAEYLKQKGMDNEELAAHTFGFFVEQYETSSLTLAIMAYYLAKYPEIQNRMRKEAEEVEKRHGTIFSYDAISEMTYTEQVVKECLRVFSPVGQMLRICAKEVTLEGPDGLKTTLKPGDQVYIPVHVIHHDPEHWENPEEFNPDRFSKENEDQRNKYVFLAFGEGPRMCPGSRMAIMQIKAGIAAVLKHFVIEKSDKMKEPLVMDPRYFLTTLRAGYWVRIKNRV